ncbi:MAG TPA: EamA family transporter [Burkholderiales bacterium]|nr:EamA family transporter [Burkholderiales bacterium]
MTEAIAGVALVILASIIEGVSQMFFKKSALVATAKKRWIVLGVALFIVQALIYTGALRFVEVSSAFPIGSIGFVVVALLSQRFLAEPVTGTRWTGVVLITLGVALLVVQA